MSRDINAKMAAQNAKLKKEFTELKEKLQECLAKVKAKKRAPVSDKIEKTAEEIGNQRLYHGIKHENKKSKTQN